MAEEFLDIYDENMKHLGKMSRDEVHNTGAWHRTIHCWIVRPYNKGFVLFQKRGRDKKLFPNTLDITAAGHYEAGETPQEGVREILEELGINVAFSDLIQLGIKFDIAKIGDVTNREFNDVYLLKRDEVPEDYQMDPSEVEGLVEINISDGLRLFSGETSSAPASGVEWDSTQEKWLKIDIDVEVKDFIPRVDPYYYKIFIMAERLMSGNTYLSI